MSCAALAAAGSLLFGQTPDWVTGQGRSARFPESVYLTGYGLATVGGEVTRERAGESAVSAARKNLVEKVRVSIQTVTSSRTEEQGERYSSFFASAVQSTASLDVEGLATATHEDGETVYAFVSVKREALRAIYAQRVASLKGELTQKAAAARSYDASGNSAKALDEYLSCYPVIRQLEESQSVLGAVSASFSPGELQREASTNEVTITTIRQAVATLLQRPLRSVDDLAWALAYQLKNPSGTDGVPSLTIMPCVYQDTRLGSPFSRFFQPILTRQITDMGRWSTVAEGQADHVLTGSYWEMKDGVRFILTVRAVADGRVVASAEATIDTKILRASGRSLRPENYKAVLADQRLFGKDEIAGGGLTLEAWTNKQTQGNLFTEGEIMKVLVRVNMPCYLRFMYHMANGKRVLLLDEYYMDASKVNLVYEIPQEFESAPPFGGEVLQLFARTDRFEKLRTVSADGYEFIQEGLGDVIAKTRGMKAARQKTLQAEQRISITTMKE